MNNTLTASRLNCFQVCPRRHYWQYEVGLRSQSESQALFIGSAWHLAMEARWQGASFEDAFAAAWPQGTNADAYIAEKIAALLKAYYTYWGDSERDGWQRMETEKEFHQPLKGVKGFEVAGVIDRLGVNASGQNIKAEYKTTGESIAPDSLYWLRLRFNTQILQYFLAARAIGIAVDLVVYDVVRKPSIAPKEISDLDADGKKIVVDQITGERIYNTKGKNALEPRQTPDKERGWIVRTHIETPEEFGERLYNDCLSRPDFYFARREVPILEDDLADFAAQRLAMAKTIVHHRKMEIKSARPEFAWPRHVSADTCQYCSYQGFCLQNIAINPEQPPSGFSIQPFNPELKNVTDATA